MYNLAPFEIVSCYKGWYILVGPNVYPCQPTNMSHCIFKNSFRGHRRALQSHHSHGCIKGKKSCWLHRAMFHLPSLCLKGQ